MTFVCARCERVIPNPYDQYRERIEYVRVDMRERAHVETLRLLCRECVEVVWTERVNPSGGAQEVLL